LKNKPQKEGPPHPNPLGKFKNTGGKFRRKGGEKNPPKKPHYYKRGEKNQRPKKNGRKREKTPEVKTAEPFSTPLRQKFKTFESPLRTMGHHHKLPF